MKTESERLIERHPEVFVKLCQSVWYTTTGTHRQSVKAEYNTDRKRLVVSTSIGLCAIIFSLRDDKFHIAIKESPEDQEILAEFDTDKQLLFALVQDKDAKKQKNAQLNLVRKIVAAQDEAEQKHYMAQNM